MKIKNSKNTKNTNNNSKNNNINNNIKNKKKINNNQSKEKFSESTSFEDVIDLLSVSPSASNPDSVTYQDQFTDYLILFVKYAFLVGILTLNFLGLSASLNCNADQELSQRIISAIFAFFFGFVYLIINYYTYKVLGEGKICKMNRDKLFPFAV
jgi:hypothetical protein